MKVVCQPNRSITRASRASKVAQSQSSVKMLVRALPRLVTWQRTLGYLIYSGRTMARNLASQGTRQDPNFFCFFISSLCLVPFLTSKDPSLIAWSAKRGQVIYWNEAVWRNFSASNNQDIRSP